eukprot:1161744-Pelagomonas_calceolata.AAC.10
MQWRALRLRACQLATRSGHATESLALALARMPLGTCHFSSVAQASPRCLHVQAKWLPRRPRSEERTEYPPKLDATTSTSETSTRSFYASIQPLTFPPTYTYTHTHTAGAHLGHEVELLPVHELERGRQVVVLHGATVIIQHRQVVADAHQVVVVHALVLVIVDNLQMRTCVRACQLVCMCVFSCPSYPHYSQLSDFSAVKQQKFARWIGRKKQMHTFKNAVPRELTNLSTMMGSHKQP